MGPGWNECRHAIEPGRIGICISADIHAVSASRINFGQHFRHPAPILLSCNLDVPNFYRQVALTSNADRFIDGGQHRPAFIAHVSGINATKFSRYARECNQFFGLGIRSWGIFQGSRNSDRSFLHSLAHQLLHLLKLCRSGLLIVIAENHAAHLRGAYIAGEINSHTLFFETGEILLKRSPVRSDVVVRKAGAVGMNDGVAQRGCRTTFARNFGRNPLINFGR